MRFEFATATQILFGGGTVKEIGPLAAQWGTSAAPDVGGGATTGAGTAVGSGVGVGAGGAVGAAVGCAAG